MSPGRISERVAGDRLHWIEKMIHEIKKLPLVDKDVFFADRRNVWTAESCLRRALEALMDLGRHILAKGFGRGVTEYKEIAAALQEGGVLSAQEAETFKLLAGYRNRIVHFYHEVTEAELYQICVSQLSDLILVADILRTWIKSHHALLDRTL